MEDIMKKFFQKFLALFVGLLLTAGVSWSAELDGSSTLEGGIVMEERSAPSGNPDTNRGWLYLKDNSSTSALYFEDDGGTVVQLGTGATTAYDDIGDPDADSSITFDNDEINAWTFADINEDMFTVQGLGAFGDVSIVKIEQKTGNATDGTVLEVVSADANVDPLVVSASGVANAFVVGQAANVTIAGVATGTDALTLTKGDITQTDGDLTLTTGDIVATAGSLTLTHADTGDLSVGDDADIGGDLDVTGNLAVTGTSTLTGTFYTSAVAPSTGNLTVNASGSGTISVGNSSTGAVTITGGGVNIGDGATDTLTITGIIDNDVTLDDGATDSPKMIFKDSDDEQTDIYQDQSSDDLNVECHDAADSLAVTVGNISVGTPNASTITINGGDFFVADDAEITGTLAVETDLDVNGTANISGSTTLAGIVLANAATIDGATANVIEWNENSEEIKWTFGTDEFSIVSTTDVVELSLFDNAPDVKLTHAADGANDDFYIQQTGAQDASLFIQSAGTGADALALTASAGGLDLVATAGDIDAGTQATYDINLVATGGKVNVTASEAVADQLKVDAQGAHAGDVINFETTNGGILLNADGANGNIDINGNTTVEVISAGTVSIDSADWDISTTGVAINMASIGFDSGAVLYQDIVEISNAEILLLRANKKELVAAPGADVIVEVVSVVLILDQGTEVFTESADNLVVEYATSGDDITATIEMTGFIDQAADTVMAVQPTNPLAANAASDMLNNAVQLFNTGDGEFAGNATADSTMTVYITYRLLTAGL